MARRHQAGIIRYTFGLEGRGMAALLNLRMALVSLAFVGLCVGLVMAMVQRPEVSLKAARNPQLMPRATDHGRVANFYTLYLTNRTGERLDASLDVDNPLKDVIMTGATRMQSLAPGDKKRFDVALETASSSLAVPRPVNIIAVGRNGQSYGSVTIYLTRPMESHEQ
jgi:hypothetical protein